MFPPDAISLGGFGATDEEMSILRSKNAEMRECFTSAVKNGTDYISVVIIRSWDLTVAGHFPGL